MFAYVCKLMPIEATFFCPMKANGSVNEARTLKNTVERRSRPTKLSEPSVSFTSTAVETLFGFVFFFVSIDFWPVPVNCGGETETTAANDGGNGGDDDDDEVRLEKSNGSGAQTGELCAAAALSKRQSVGQAEWWCTQRMESTFMIL